MVGNNLIAENTSFTRFQKRSLLSRYWYIFLLCLVLIPLLQVSPFVQALPSRDSSIFLYVGKKILQGFVPYRDIWDHKGPVIYFINALGLAIGNRSIWGVWFLEVVFLFIAALSGYKIIDLSYGYYPAILSSMAWLFSLLNVLQGGNYTEEYSLELNFIALLLFWLILTKRNHKKFLSFLLGMNFALSFFLRPNNVGLFISIFIVVGLFVIFSKSELPKVSINVLFAFLGGFLIFSTILLYFYIKGSLYSFKDAFITYNLLYSSSSNIDKINSGLYGIAYLTIPPAISIFAITGWFVGCLDWVKSIIQKQFSKQAVLLLVALIDFPLEIIFSSISGRNYGHYYILWLPSMAILFGFAIEKLRKILLSQDVHIFRQRINTSRVLFFALILPIAFLPLLNFTKNILNVRKDRGEFEPISSQISLLSEDHGFLLMWGSEVMFNNTLAEDSPSKFIYQYPLLTPGYCSRSNAEEFFRAIKQKKPLIVDTSTTNILIPSLNINKQSPGANTNYCITILESAGLFDFIKQNYQEIGIIRPHGWKVLKYKEDQ